MTSIATPWSTSTLPKVLTLDRLCKIAVLFNLRGQWNPGYLIRQSFDILIPLTSVVRVGCVKLLDCCRSVFQTQDVASHGTRGPCRRCWPATVLKVHPLQDQVSPGSAWTGSGELIRATKPKINAVARPPPRICDEQHFARIAKALPFYFCLTRSCASWEEHAWDRIVAATRPFVAPSMLCLSICVGSERLSAR